MDKEVREKNKLDLKMEEPDAKQDDFVAVLGETGCRVAWRSIAPVCPKQREKLDGSTMLTR